MTEDFNLSNHLRSGFVSGIFVKEYIALQIKIIEDRIAELSQFDGLGEVMLQKAELSVVRRNLLKYAGDKLV